MGQVTLYLEDEIETKMSQAAKSSGLSKSKWVSSLIREKVSEEWPTSIVQLAGAWRDFPSIEEIRRGMGQDTKREKL